MQASTLRISNTVINRDFFARRLWREMDTLRARLDAQRQVQQQIHDCAAHIESLCSEHGVSPSALEGPSRRAYRWMRFISDPARLVRHLDALYRGRAVALEMGLVGHDVLEIHLMDLGALWRVRQKPDRAVLQCHQGFMRAGRDEWEALLGSALVNHTRNLQHTLNSYTTSASFAEVTRALEALAHAEVGSEKGAAHDLRESFLRVNDHYFDGQMEAPRLAWSHSGATRKFGHYDFARDLLVLSAGLDRPGVPTRVLDFVMYHELLHKKHGLTLSETGRLMGHTPAFRADEQLFEGWQEAELWLSRLAQDQEDEARERRQNKRGAGPRRSGAGTRGRARKKRRGKGQR